MPSSTGCAFSPLCWWCLNVYYRSQRDLCSQTAITRFLSKQSWLEIRNIKINEEKGRAIYFCRGLSLAKTYFTLIGRNIPFVNHVKYLGAISDKKLGRIHIEHLLESTPYSKANHRMPKLHYISIQHSFFYNDLCLSRGGFCDRYFWKNLWKILNFMGHTLIWDLKSAFRISNVYDFITKICREQTKSYKGIRMKTFATLDKAKPNTKQIKEAKTCQRSVLWSFKWLSCHYDKK
jgi:hypothetical protein